MIRVTIGDLFESDAQTLVNTVNCVGVMGKGIALHFKTRFPDMYEDYVRRCDAGVVKLGRPYLYRRLLTPWIINFPTKDHWRSVARLSDIVAGLSHLKAHCREWEITSIAVPPLGCGEGGLEWRVVGPTLYRNLQDLGIPVTLYAPYGTPVNEIGNEFLAKSPDLVALAGRGQGRVSPAWIALVDILARIEKEPFRWPVGRTTFQKIAYFATEHGLPTGLRFTRGSYGPYAADLKARTSQLVNNGLIQESQLGNMLEVKVGPTFEDARKTYGAEIERYKPTVERIVDLFLRMNTHQAEIAATVVFAAEDVAKESGSKPSEMQVLAYVSQWKQRRRPPLAELEVAESIRNLTARGWLDVEPSHELPLESEMFDSPLEELSHSQDSVQLDCSQNGPFHSTPDNLITA